MSDEVKDELVLAATDTEVAGTEGSMVIRQGYIPPLDGSDDLVHAFDMRIARGVAEVLVRTYFGYEWHVTADSKQGIVYFSIPDLMGPTLKQVIRLAQYADLTPELIVKTGGELLERMELPRGPFEMSAYLAAKRNRDRFDFGSMLKKGRG